jgi:predicted deacylase
MDLITTPIPSDTPGSSFALQYYRFGTAGQGQKIYMQAGLHADEQPGMLILHHLLSMLERAEAEGRLHGEVVVMPMVNPLGMAHLQFHTHRGRYHPVNGLNYNRRWLDLDDALFAHSGDLSTKLGQDAEANRALVLSLLREWHQSSTPVTALDHLRHAVTAEAMDADMVLDLHCDDEALNHLFVVPQLMPDYQDLADWIGSVTTLTAEDSGGGSFDEVWPGLWIKLARRYPDAAWPALPFAATLEYRGQPDVQDAINRKDAENLYGFLVGRGVIDDQVETPPAAPAALPLDATDIVRVQKPGLIAYRVALGDVVKKGDVIADLIALDGDQIARQRTPIQAGTGGLVFSLNQMKYVQPGTSIAKIAGKEALASRQGYLLED